MLAPKRANERDQRSLWKRVLISGPLGKMMLYPCWVDNQLIMTDNIHFSLVGSSV